MGQDYAKGVYRKNYEGDYVKAYEDRAATKKEHAKRLKSYKEITQNQGFYNKKEKGVYDPGNTERTMDIFEEPSAKIEERKKTNQVRKKEPVTYTQEREAKKKQTPPPIPKQAIISPKETNPKVSAEDKSAKEVQSKSKSKSRDYDVYRKMVVVPVMKDSSGIYREMKDKELVDEKEARYILDYAGFKKKADIDYLRFAIIAFIAAMIIGYVGALLALAWSFFYKQRNYIVLEKKSAMSNLSIRMPAKEEETNEINTSGNIYLGISVVMLVVVFLKAMFL